MKTTLLELQEVLDSCRKEVALLKEETRKRRLEQERKFSENIKSAQEELFPRLRGATHVYDYNFPSREFYVAIANIGRSYCLTGSEAINIICQLELKLLFQTVNLCIAIGVTVICF